MYLFVDESGTNKQTGSSVVAVVLADEVTMLAAESVVTSAESVAKTKLFHWKSSPWKVRKVFFREINALPFKVAYTVHKNPVTDFSAALESSLLTVIADIEVKTIFLDGKKGKAYERNIKKILRDQGLSSRKLRTANDEAFPLLRVADAYAGLLRHYLNDKSLQSKAIYRIVKKHIN